MVDRPQGKFANTFAEGLFSEALSLHERHGLSGEELSKIKLALDEITAIMHERESEGFTVRQARLSDIDSMLEMISYWAQQGENLPRRREDLVSNVSNFAVCTERGVVCGCACIFVYDSGLAEIRSLGVSPRIQRQGQGRAIVEFLLRRAHAMEIRKVFVLTRSPGFFSHVGFTATTKEALPEKILKDCEKCHKKERCDELAYEYVFEDLK
ncbi:MAG: GNAT family N-acetyltransferase [Succinivibrionaceae bacterium]|nr:GNAT family N-acetyltransferase [Succinivibrionaceae bacterium]